MNAYVSAGGNVGADSEIIERFREAARQLPVSRSSRVYRTAPVGPVADQPPFLNVALELSLPEPVVDPPALLASLHAIETALGRDRSRAVRFGPRAIDLDLLLVGDLVALGDPLLLPHPRMHERAFVLRPLAELVGEDYALPGGKTIADCLADPEVAAQDTELVTLEALRL